MLFEPVVFISGVRARSEPSACLVRVLRKQAVQSLKHSSRSSCYADALDFVK